MRRARLALRRGGGAGPRRRRRRARGAGGGRRGRLPHGRRATAPWASTCARRHGTSQRALDVVGRGASRAAVAAQPRGRGSLPGGPVPGVGRPRSWRPPSGSRRRATGAPPHSPPRAAPTSSTRSATPASRCSSRRALALLEDEPPCPETVTVLGKLGRSLWLAGDPRGGLEKLEESLDLASGSTCPSRPSSSATAAASAASWATSAGWPTTSAPSRWPASAAAWTRPPCSPSTTRTRCSRTADPPAAARRWRRGWTRRAAGASRPSRRCRRATPSPPGCSESGTPRPRGASTRQPRRGARACSASGTRRSPLAAELMPRARAQRGRRRTSSSSARRRRCCASCRGEPSLAAPFLDWLEQRGLESEIPWISAYALLTAATVRLGSARPDAAHAACSTAGSAARGPAAARTTWPTCRSRCAPPSVPATTRSRAASRRAWRPRCRCSATSAPR